MQTKNQPSIIRKTFYLIMLLSVFISAFSANNLPSAQAEPSVNIINLESQFAPLISNSLFLYASTVLDFDTQNFLDQQSGTLRDYSEEIDEQVWTAAESIEYNAVFYGINPQLILVILETQNHVVTQNDAQIPLRNNPSGELQEDSKFFYHVKWLSEVVVQAFNARRDGEDNGQVTFESGEIINVPLDLNAGTYGVQILLAKLLLTDQWLTSVTGPDSLFKQSFFNWFGDPLVDPDAQEINALALPSGYNLPFPVGHTWYFTGGPHTYTSSGARPWSSADFAPPEVTGCSSGSTTYNASRWIVAARGGNVITSQTALVVIDHGDGWRTYYSHVSTTDRRGTGGINQGDNLGHPSCQVEPGGSTTGIHVHFAIYQVGVGFVNISGSSLSGWNITETSHYNGTMTRQGVTRTATTGRHNGTNDILNSGSSETNNCQNTGGSGIRLYDGTNCTGTEKYFSSAGFTNMPDIGFNDMASSINVGDGWSARVYEHDNRGGSSRCINGDMWDLDQDYYTSGDTNRKINNDISSIEVYNNSSCTGGSAPNVPSNLRNSSSTQTSITMSWDDVSNETGYKIYEWNGSTFVYLASVGANTTSYTETRANCGWDEIYDVTAFNSYGESAHSDWEQGFTQSCPVVPNAPSLSTPSNGQFFNEGESINLSWSATGSEYYGEFWGGPGGTLTFGWQSGTSNNIGSQWAGYTYSWHVKARNGSNESGWSETRTFTVRPGAPSNLSATTASCSQINLSWSDNSGNEEGYKVYRNGSLIATLGSGTTSYQNNGLSGSTSYSYTVKAYRASIESNASNTANVTTTSCGLSAPTLSNPANNTTFNRTDSISLSWNTVSGATQYYAEFWGGPSINVNSGWTANTSWPLGSQWGGSYQWRVKAKNSSGQESAWSETRTLNIKPGTPTNLSASVLSSDQIKLTWNASSDAPGNIDGYRIYRNGTAIATVTSSTNTYQNNGLSCATSYSYYVKAYKGSLESNSSSTVSPSTQACPTAVRATAADTRDGSWGLKSSFDPGDPIKWTIHVENTTAADVQVDVGYIVKDPNNSIIVNHSETITTGPGIRLWGLPGTVTGIGGTYTFIGSVTYLGVKSERTTTYTVNGPTQTDISILIGGTSQGTYPIVPETSQVLKYLVDGGPVEISSNNGVPIIASLNQWRRNAAQPQGWFTGVAQSMALPVEQITNRYVMPRYNGTNPTLYDAVLMANVDTVPRTITVTIGGTVMGTYPLAPSASVYATYPITGGPIVVSSDSGAKIVASLYELKRSQAGVPWNGQSEMMGLPAGQLSDKYLLPIYFGAANPATLDARLYFANVDTIATTVEVKIAGVSRGTYPMQPSTSMEVKYLVDGGPVEISSNNGAKIVASLNQWRRNAAEPADWFTGVAQSMALPVELITDKYVIPHYNGTDPTLYNAVLLANVDTVPRTLTVTIGGTVMGSYPLAPSASVYATYNITDGPIVVSSDVGAKIVASLYELKRYQAGVPWNGQSEMMGLPFGQLSDQYLLPIYFGAANPLTLDARLYIAVP